MSYVQQQFQVVETTLASAVADDGTFTVAYPSGTTQADFNVGLNASNGYVILDNNDRIAEGADGVEFTFGASEITVTNRSGYTWTAGTDVTIQLEQQEGNDVVYLDIPVKLAAITGAGDVLTNFRPGIAGTIEYVQFAVTSPVTTAAKAASLNLEIGATNVTGGVVALTSANATPLGAVIAGTAITGANTLTKDDAISVEAASVTAFAEGEGVLSIRIRKAA